MSPAPTPLDPDESRRARHRHMLDSLAERAHALAMKAADRAEADLDTPTADPAIPNAHQTFERYARIVRLLVVADHRIATGAPTTRRPYRAIGPDTDPRSPQLRQFLHHATRNSPDRAQLRRAALETLDQSLEQDPARTRAPADILSELCQQYGLPFDIAQLPDEFLEVQPVGAPDDG